MIKNTLNPFWPPFSLKANLFGDEKRRIRVTCYDWDSDGSHDLIGVFHTSLSELQSGEKLRWNLINEKKTKKKNYKNSGVIECSVEVCINVVYAYCLRSMFNTYMIVHIHRLHVFVMDIVCLMRLLRRVGNNTHHTP